MDATSEGEGPMWREAKPEVAEESAGVLIEVLGATRLGVPLAIAMLFDSWTTWSG
jgi:hypothetical protein